MCIYADFQHDAEKKASLAELIVEDFDDILDLVGGYGRYQKWVMYGCVTPLTFLLSVVAYSTVFTMFIPEHHCSPGVPMDAATLDKWKQEYIPLETGPDGSQQYSSCSVYNFTEEIVKVKVPCQHGWAYSTKDFDRTIATDNDWVCQREVYPTTVYTLMAVGFLVGNIILGQLTDKLGRRPVLFISVALYITCQSISPFVTHIYWAYVTVMFIASAGYPMMYSLPVILMAELCDGDHRAWCYTVNWVAWVLGMAFIPVLAYLVRDWFVITICITAPGFLLFVLFAFIPESPRWLLSRGRFRDAAKIMLNIARGNGKPMDANLIEDLLKLVVPQRKQEDEKMLGVWSLFRTKRIAMVTCCIAVARTASSMVSEQLSFNTPYMSGNQFLNFFIVAVVQLPGTVLAGYLIDKTGRRWISVLAAFVIGGICLVAGVVPEHMNMLRVASSILANFGVSIVLYVLYLQTAELFPTPLRATGSALCTTTASIGSLLNPTFVYTRKFYYGAPFLAMASISVVGAVAAAFLPETMGRNLPETLEEASQFGVEDKFWSFRSQLSRRDRRATLCTS